MNQKDCSSTRIFVQDMCKEIGDEEPYYSTKISIFSFLGGLVWLLYTKQAQCNEGCAKLTSRSVIIVGLDRTGHMSFLTGQDQTPKFAGQVLPDRTESGLIFLDILPYKKTKKKL